MPRSIGALIAVTVAVAACGSSHRGAVDVSSPTTPPPTVAPATTSHPSAALTPTVANCGGGAYRPATLLIVCGDGLAATRATGVSWQTWTATGASGNGTVHLAVAGRSVAGAGELRLGQVESGPVGPQFRRLVVTWIGPSPDGHATDTFTLPAGA